MSNRPLTPQEKRAWARVARSVRPIASERMQDLVEGTPADPGFDLSPPASTAKKKPVQGRQSEVGPDTVKRPSPAADRSGERKIRRGQVAFQARIDLHGHTQASADAALMQFVSQARTNGARTVLVITGKGRNSEGVLRRNFLHWLESAPARDLVSGWAPAHPKHGGAGAFYVFLRRV